MRISVSSRLPQTGTQFGFAQLGTWFHDRMARMGTTRGPSPHGRRYGFRFTGRRTEYSSPSGGTSRSNTWTDAVPRQVSNVPLLLKSAQNVTYSRLPAVQGPPE